VKEGSGGSDSGRGMDRGRKGVGSGESDGGRGKRKEEINRARGARTVGIKNSYSRCWYVHLQ